MTVDRDVTLRADARRNRDKIINAARAIFASSGLESPMEEIARTAGVGVGTLYRRFPDREALIKAVAVESFERVLSDAKAAAAAEPTAWEALVWLMRHSVELQLSIQLAMVSPRVREILKTDSQVREHRAQLIDLLGELVCRAQEEGTLRTDVGAGDIAMMCAMSLRQMHAKSAETARLGATRCIAIMIDGLRTRDGAPLPGHPLTGDDLDVPNVGDR
ncbi:TetR/AcrR family transcriptional regulator [Amycolatopsis sp. NPDC058278]|uniref:TetR/AcrR family transcriptional regulator n=1 Tax=Amycolatopsis sp. NPDC058278 TaxID=3346417 RepID=UPI0036D94043